MKPKLRVSQCSFGRGKDGANAIIIDSTPFVLCMGKNEKELCGGEAHTTNQQMELQAAVEALKALTRPCRITIISDSKYVVQGMNEWIHN